LAEDEEENDGRHRGMTVRCIHINNEDLDGKSQKYECGIIITTQSGIVSFLILLGKAFISSYLKSIKNMRLLVRRY